MFFCIDCEGICHEGKTLTEAYKKAERSGGVYSKEELIFIEGQKIKVDFQVVPATTVAAVAKKGTK